MFDFFCENHGLTHLKISNAWNFKKISFSGVKSILFGPEFKKTIFCGLICPKNKDDKKFDFLTKTVD